jgi:hypothetical protein
MRVHAHRAFASITERNSPEVGMELFKRILRRERVDDRRDLFAVVGELVANEPLRAGATAAVQILSAGTQ